MDPVIFYRNRYVGVSFVAAVMGLGDFLDLGFKKPSSFFTCVEVSNI